MNTCEDIGLEEPRQVKPGDVVAGRYRIERQIASGGMGVVFAARHVALDNQIAVKFVQPLLVRNREAVVRFINEAKAVAKLRNEHLVRVLDVGWHANGVPFMVLEYLQGEDLADILARGGRCPIHVAVGYILQACEGLAEAHAHGIVHRDLKPENLFIAECPDGERLLKVLDFGISKQLSESKDRSLTNPSQRIGSPDYMAPETMRKPSELDQRADIWALGVVLYELLAGRLPFAADGIPAICAKVLSEEPAPLRSFRADVPEQLVAVVLKCLNKDPNYRYGTVAELAAALSPFMPSGDQLASRTARILSSQRHGLRHDGKRQRGRAGIRGSSDSMVRGRSITKNPLVAFFTGAATAAACLIFLWVSEPQPSVSLRSAVALTAAPLFGWSRPSEPAREPSEALCTDFRPALPVDRWMPVVTSVRVGPSTNTTGDSAQSATQTTMAAERRAFKQGGDQL